ncbi:unnamed protein product [Mytilus coruscus]|uniref:Uncharacterized protein n=1 Tax=Mytilus coruscus TaxID=42192 RepID=A0A6J8BE59_MYTCO|nr:unnamed protein product [Mytilus coruscus]
MASSSSLIVTGSLVTNYARIGHAAQQLFPDILQELITIKEPPQRLFHDININKYLSKKLRPDEWSMINDVMTKGYANFDIPLIYKLVRNLNLVPWPTKGWDHPTAPCLTEVTPGDDLERIRRFRNGILHRGNAQVTDTELSQHFTEFKDIAGRLETYMGKQTGEFVDKLVDLETCCMDEETSNVYISRLESLKKRDEDCQKRLHAVEEDVDALKKRNPTEGLEKTAIEHSKQLGECKSETNKLGEIQTQHIERFENLEQKTDSMQIKVEEHGKEMKELKENQQSQTEGLEKTTKEHSKQLDESKTETNKLGEIQTQQIERFENLEQQTDFMKIKQEEHGKEMKEFKEKQQSQTEGLEKTVKEHSKQLDESKTETNKLGEIQAQHIKKFENLEQTTDSLKIKAEEHGNAMKEFTEKQQNMYSMDAERREIDKITLPESFVKTEEVTKGADALRDNGFAILVGIKGSGKSTIGMAILKQFCAVTPDYDIIKLPTTEYPEIYYFGDNGLFRQHRSRYKIVVFLDDLFGRIPSKYAFKEHLMLLKCVNERKDILGIKILITVHSETKACFEELFTSDTLLSTAEIINLPFGIYPRRNMLITIGIDEKRSDNILRQMEETRVQERIGFPALVSILKGHLELEDELFTNPVNALMNYLSSLNNGNTHDKMYFVLLIHVLMTGNVLEEHELYKDENEKEKNSMCTISKILFEANLNLIKYL